LTLSLINNAGGRFALDPASGQLTVADASLIDFEGAASHTVVVRVTDSTSFTYTQSFKIAVNDVNEASSDLLLSNASLDENAAAGALVGTVTANDPDAGDSQSFALTNDAGGRFAIDAASGAITVVDGSLLDFEAAASHTVTVQVTDSALNTFAKAFTISLNDVNETPTDLVLSSSNVDESVTTGTVLGTVTPSDPDAGETFTFALIDDAGGRFAIDAATGEITINDGGLIDFEAAASHLLTVQVTDSANHSYSEDFTIGVNDVNEAPTVADRSFTLAENTAGGTLLGTVVAADQDAGDSLTYAIAGGTGAGAFAIDPATGVLTIADPALLDFETAPSLTLIVEARDSGLLSGSGTITVNSTDVNEAPVVVTPVPPLQSEAGRLFSYNLPAEVFVDVDLDDTFTLAATLANGSPLPGWLGFDGRTFTGRPADEDVALLTIRLTATDGGGASSFLDFELDVGPAGTLPTIIGSDSGDVLVGTDADELLIGGLGNDQLTGGAGDDVYLFALGDGEDTIINAAAGAETDLDTLELGVGLLADDVVLALNGRDLEITFISSTSDKVTLTGFAGIETLDRILFSDGAQWSSAEIWSRLRPGLENDDTLTGTNGWDVLYGGPGADTLESREGQDVLIGGTGDDVMRGGWHPDTYVYSLGDGHDTIEEYASSTYGERETGNRLELGAGVSREGVILLRDVNDWQDVTLSFADQEGSILLDEQFGGSKYGVETIAFADGTTWDMTTLAALAGSEGDDAITGTDDADRLTGFSGNDTIDGGAGGDLVDGGAGADILTGGLDSDTFIFEDGDGADSINDFETGAGGDAMDVTNFGFASFSELSAKFSQVGADVLVELDADDSVTLVGVNVSDLLEAQFVI